MTNTQTREPAPVQAVVFDFDGTLSTLRHGWETVMEPMMLEMICGGEATDDVRKEVAAYIDESTGVQTIHQMKWLAEAVKRHGKNKNGAGDPWAYKAEYNRRLMLNVSERLKAIENGRKTREEFMIRGSREMLSALKLRGVKLYAASGTDHPDVVRESKALRLYSFFDEVRGAPVGAEDCSKEAVLKRLTEQAGLSGDRVAVIGDGKVEITLGKQIGARALGLASDEETRSGINPQKKRRLAAAGADLILGDFTDLRAVLSFLGFSHNPTLLFAHIHTESAGKRVNLVTIGNMLTPGLDPVPPWGSGDFDTLVKRMQAARANHRPVIFSMGAHVIKNRLSRYLIALMREGWVTHLAGNGACSIHDFELCYLGGTSEDVPTAIEDGSFGMWEETGRWMNTAIAAGWKEGYGYGESLARYIDGHPGRFPYRDDCVLYQAWKLGVPATYHIALGTDIIHQHPATDFQAIGGASGIDFHSFCFAVSQLSGGVFLNFGSGVIGPEVFLKALSISRNLGYQTFDITTANFDLIDLGDYRRKVGHDDPRYYYRPRKNIVLRPVSRGGMGWHFVGNHLETIPNLYEKLTGKGGRQG
ncbi:MAG: HAD family hydrolase [Bacillota bacterium]